MVKFREDCRNGWINNRQTSRTILENCDEMSDRRSCLIWNGGQVLCMLILSGAHSSLFCLCIILCDLGTDDTEFRTVQRERRSGYSVISVSVTWHQRCSKELILRDKDLISSHPCINFILHFLAAEKPYDMDRIEAYTHMYLKEKKIDCGVQ